MNLEVFELDLYFNLKLLSYPSICSFYIWHVKGKIIFFVEIKIKKMKWSLLVELLANPNYIDQAYNWYGFKSWVQYAFQPSKQKKLL